MGQAKNRIDGSIDDLDNKSIPGEESSPDIDNKTSKKEEKIQQFLNPDQEVIIASKFNIDKVDKDENLIEL